MSILHASFAALALLSTNPVEPAPTPAPVAASATETSANETGDLVVNGERIPEEAVRREMVYRLGQRYLETRKLQYFIEQEAAARDLDLASLLGEGEVDGVVEEGKKKIEEEYKDSGLSVDDVLKNNKLTTESWRDQTRLTLLFNRLFLPENPDDWPEVTLAALEGTVPAEQRDQFLARLREGYEKRKAEDKLGDPNDQQRMMFNMLLRPSIMASLAEKTEIRTASDGLPPRLVMTLGDVEITTDEAFKSIKANVAPIEWERTRLWLAKTTAVRQELKERDAYLSDEEFGAVWDELVAKYENSILPLENIALAIKRFPSVDAYRLYRRALESYATLIEDEINEENLTAHLDRTNRLMGLEEVDAEVILLSAYEFKNSSWKENGWEEAKQRATAAAKRLAAGESWDEVLEDVSDFWDPPVPASQAGQRPQNRKNQGRFGLKNRNTLLQMVDEHEYLIFLQGYSLGDTIFFDQEAGTVGGPYRGPYGYYIVKVNGRKPASKAYSLDVPNERESIVQDYLQVRFNQFAAEVMAESDIEGL